MGSLVTANPDARVIAASQLPLAQLVAHGDFRQDLMGRLADAIELFLPPLRELKEDLEALTAHALEAEARVARAEPVSISREAFAILQAYDWPCNVRELIGVVRSGAFLARRDGGLIEPWHIKDTVRRAVGHDCGSSAECRANEVERVLVVCRGNLAETARRLDRKERTLRRWVKHLGIDLERIRREARGRSV